MSIHPQIIEKDGRKEFVVLPYEEFLQMQEEIEKHEDLRTLREEKATVHAEPTRSLVEVLGESAPEPVGGPLQHLPPPTNAQYLLFGIRSIQSGVGAIASHRTP